jgi:calcineurin-like phosphoesterase family protein
MSSVKFISDLHLGHTNVCRFRTQFSSVDEHDSFIKDSILSSLTKRSKLFLLGDIAFTSEAGDWVVNELLNYCPNTVIVLGNHCTDTSERRSNLVKYVQAGIKIHGLTTYKDAWLSHCPIHPQEMRKKNLNVCGHLHLNNVMRIDQEGNLDLRYFNVSCENIDYTPISYNQILERVNYE